MKNYRAFLLRCCVFGSATVSTLAGPYSAGFGDAANPFDAPIPGFLGPHGEGKARLEDGFGEVSNPDNFLNPVFFGWARSVSQYHRADGEQPYSDPMLALGPVTGDNFDVVSLGDLSATQIAANAPRGQLTLSFNDALHPEPIRDLPGADFVVFENGFISGFNTGGAGIGGVFAELAYVEVSSDGVNFARFPSVSLTAAPVGGYGTINPTNVFNLAGKHINAYGECWGTPFDLAALANHPSVLNHTVDLKQIRHIRLVDIPGDGSSKDSATPNPRPIYDSWLTFGSGGADVEAVGAISVVMNFDQWQTLKGLTGSQRGAEADPDGDSVSNLLEYAFSMEPLKADAASAPKMLWEDGKVCFAFQRDMRASDLTVELQVSSDLRQPWQTIAQTNAESVLVPTVPNGPTITDTSASSIASLGVVRRHVIEAQPERRFFRLRVVRTP